MPATATKTKEPPAAVTASLTAETAGLREALAAVSGVIKARTPKPILANCLLDADPGEGSTLAATDLELAVRVRVPGLACERPFRVVLHPGRLHDILAGARSETVDIEVLTAPGGEAAPGTLRVTAGSARFELPTEDPDLFPDVPGFDAAAYSEVTAADLRKLVRRTAFAVDPDSQRYALGGCRLTFGEASVTFVATDGRRVARLTAPAERVGDPAADGVGPVGPARALPLLDRLSDPADPPVHLSADRNAAVFRTERAVLYTRLLEGRFPRVEDCFPGGPAPVTAAADAGELLWACTQAAVATSEESRGVDFAWGPAGLTLRATAADVGSGEVAAALRSYDGPPLTVTFDTRFLTGMLKALEPGEVLTVKLTDEKSPALFTTEDGYEYVVMPLTREK
jgi:DNA polymerase-3 subunit beta